MKNAKYVSMGLLILTCAMPSVCFGGFGWWDLFAVTASNNNQYYWDMTWGDPVIFDSPDPGTGLPSVDDYNILENTPPVVKGWGWGGYDWGPWATNCTLHDNGSLEFFTNQTVSFEFEIDNTSGGTLSFVLDTLTRIHADRLFPSWGTISNIMLEKYEGGDWQQVTLYDSMFVTSKGIPDSGGEYYVYDEDGTVDGDIIDAIRLAPEDFNNFNTSVEGCEFCTQVSDIYGAGISLSEGAYRLSFDPDLYTWDSYYAPTSDYYGGAPTHHKIPEPGTLIFLATGLIGVLAYAWRKRR